ncbi:MAG: homoserine O-acetyltransferase [Actinomycetota bacterium]|nr:homoserine O-acetyltransferase [Actinomycetota bacterium]
MVEDKKQITKTEVFSAYGQDDPLVLECGKELAPVNVAYETYGQLNQDRTNAILIFHALSGDSHAAFYHSSQDKKPGWWDFMIGPGKPFDTGKFFIICANVLGGCKGSTGPSSLNPGTGKPYGISFPPITITDMLKPQQRLVQHLGIKKLMAVAGGSMGGMLSLQWALNYPQMARGAIFIATAPTHTAQAIAFNSVGRYAIISDPNWNNGDYYGQEQQPLVGLKIARMIGHITYISQQSMHQKFGRKSYPVREANIDFFKEFEVESYLQYKGESFVRRFDPNSYLYITKAIDAFNLYGNYGSLAEALKPVKAKSLVISFSSDWLYPQAESAKIVKALKINGIDTTYCNIESPYGHDSFLLDLPKFKDTITGFIHSLGGQND